VTHHGRVLDKDELLRVVWHGAIVDENNLPRGISTLRKALHERPGQRDYIATIPGVGYRFVADVVECEELPAIAGTDLTDSGAVALVPSALPTDEIEPPTTGITAASAVPPDRRVRPWRWALTAAFGAVAMAVVALAWTTSTPQSTPAPVSGRVQRTIWPFTTGGSTDHEPVWSPDGTALAYTSDAEGTSDIWIQKVAGGPPVRVTAASVYNGEPDWSPDGRFIVFRSQRDGGGIFVVSAEGGTPRRLSTFGFRPRWSPRGDRVLFSAANPDTAASLRLYVIDAGGGEPRLIKTGDARTISAAWHPDGRHISVLSGGGDMFASIPLDGGAIVRSTIAPEVQQQIRQEGLRFGHFVWARSGDALFLDGMSHQVRNLWRIRVDPRTLAWVGGPDRLTTGAAADTEVAVSPDGTRLAFSTYTGGTAIWSFPFDPARGRMSAQGRPINATANLDRGAYLEADGHRVVYRTLRGDRQELWEHTDGGDRLLLAASDWEFSAPRWSPDGRKVVFARTHAGPRGQSAAVDRALAVLAVDTARQELLTTPGSQRLLPTDWSHDGQWILTACKTAGRAVGICRLPVAAAPHAERALRVVSSTEDIDLFQQRFSPDDRWISFIGVPTEDSSTSKVFVMPSDGGTWQPLTDGTAYDDKPRWAPDGRTIYFISNRDGHFNVWGRHIDPITGTPAGEIFRVTTFGRSSLRLAPYLEQMDMTVLPDRLLLPMFESSGQIWILDHADQ
jgi:Tol biopolymer transport system component